eukprot:7041968-Prymnesium_polylepis.2
MSTPTANAPARHVRDSAVCHVPRAEDPAEGESGAVTERRQYVRDAAPVDARGQRHRRQPRRERDLHRRRHGRAQRPLRDEERTADADERVGVGQSRIIDARLQEAGPELLAVRLARSKLRGEVGGWLLARRALIIERRRRLGHLHARRVRAAQRPACHVRTQGRRGGQEQHDERHW